MLKWAVSGFYWAQQRNMRESRDHFLRVSFDSDTMVELFPDDVRTDVLNIAK